MGNISKESKQIQFTVTRDDGTLLTISVAEALLIYEKALDLLHKMLLSGKPRL